MSGDSTIASDVSVDIISETSSQYEEKGILCTRSRIPKCFSWKLYYWMALVLSCITFPVSIGLAFNIDMNFMWLMLLVPILAFMCDIVTKISHLRQRYQWKDNVEQPTKPIEVRRAMGYIYLLLLLASLVISVGFIMYLIHGNFALVVCLLGLVVCSSVSCMKVYFLSLM